MQGGQQPSQLHLLARQAGRSQAAWQREKPLKSSIWRPCLKLASLEGRGINRTWSQRASNGSWERERERERKRERVLLGSRLGREGHYSDGESVGVSTWVPWVRYFFAVWGCPVYYRIFSSIPGPSPLNAGSTFPLAPPNGTTELSPDTAKCLPGIRITPGWEPLVWHIKAFSAGCSLDFCVPNVA